MRIYGMLRLGCLHFCRFDLRERNAYNASVGPSLVYWFAKQTLHSKPCIRNIGGTVAFRLINVIEELLPNPLLLV
jgi:hypothetical protein